jgi:phage-related minor tail protein
MDKRPQNCGTGYCSCVECLFKGDDHSEDVLDMVTLTMKDALDVLDVLEDSRDDVAELLGDAKRLEGYPRHDRRIEAYEAQLAKHERMIRAVRAAIGGE